MQSSNILFPSCVCFFCIYMQLYIHRNEYCNIYTTKNTAASWVHIICSVWYHSVLLLHVIRYSHQQNGICAPGDLLPTGCAFEDIWCNFITCSSDHMMFWIILFHWCLLVVVLGHSFLPANITWLFRQWGTQVKCCLANTLHLSNNEWKPRCFITKNLTVSSLRF